MKTGLSLTALATELERRATSKQDFVASTDSIEMSTAQGEPTLILPADVAPQGLVINDLAHNQIAGRLDIPVKYYNKMRSNAPELLRNNVNHWFSNNKETRMIRTLDGKVRAFLSDKYQRIENEEIASVVLPLLLAQEGLQVVSTEITETRMYIKAVFPKVQGEVLKGDVVQSGICISNSEVGHGAVKIEPLVFRLVCLNGMIINDSAFRGRHVGARADATDSVYEMLTDETKQADDRAILLKVRDVVNASFDEVRFAAHLNKMREAAGEKIEGNPAEAVKLLAKKEALNEFETGSILRNLIEGADISRWGLLNAVTATAKEDALTYDRATELETLGGKILNLPRTEWVQLAQAA